MKAINPNIKEAARQLYLQGHTLDEIVDILGTVSRRTLYAWRKQDRWDLAQSRDEPEDSMAHRLAALALKLNKTAKDLHEMQGLTDMLAKLRRSNHPPPIQTTASGQTPSRGKSSGESRKKTTGSNDLTGIKHQTILDKFTDGLFAYQRAEWDRRDLRVRNHLKSRQAGFTWYFAREALADALLTGRNKIFLSASKRQSLIFRDYIAGFAAEWFDKEIRGQDKIRLKTDQGEVQLYFLSTNSATAQGYHGDVYMDEYFWIPGHKFKALNKLASAMASQKQYHRTYFSTPSTTSHPAYALWSMADYNAQLRRKKAPEVILPKREILRQGVQCPDGQFRQITTLDDVIAGGCDLFDRAQLELDYPDPAEFGQLFDVEFMDDQNSVFNLEALQHLMVDSSDWRDFHPELARPLGHQKVVIGYDPSRSVDGASIVVLALPDKPGGVFRVLEVFNLYNCAWDHQASTIRDLTQKYDVAGIYIDRTGNGNGVYETVKQFYPAAVGLHYSVTVKTDLVLKAQQVIGNRRLAWDASHTRITASFMKIRRALTQNNSQVTFVADRSAETGHADVAWAIMHGLQHEGLPPPDGRPGCTVAFSKAA